MPEIAQWLEELGLGQYAQRFAENDIDLAILLDLTDQDLKEVGVSSLGHRRQLPRAIAEFDQATAASTARAPASASSAAPAEAAERRHVTVMFSDLVGSTALSARMDPEDMLRLRRLRAPFWAVWRWLLDLWREPSFSRRGSRRH